MLHVHAEGDPAVGFEQCLQLAEAGGGASHALREEGNSHAFGSRHPSMSWRCFTPTNPAIPSWASPIRFVRRKR